MRFNVESRDGGVKSKFGNEYDIDMDDAILELIYFDMVSVKWTEEELEDCLTKMKRGEMKIIAGQGGLTQIEVTKI